MSIQKYLLLTPESLVVSMLEPQSFGTYLATGTKKRAHEEAIYSELTFILFVSFRRGNGKRSS